MALPLGNAGEKILILYNSLVELPKVDKSIKPLSNNDTKEW